MYPIHSCKGPLPAESLVSTLVDKGDLIQRFYVKTSGRSRGGTGAGGHDSEMVRLLDHIPCKNFFFLSEVGCLLAFAANGQ